MGGKCIEKCNFYVKYFDKIICYAYRPYLVFSELKHTCILFWPKHCILNCEQNVVNFAGKWGGEMY